MPVTLGITTFGPKELPRRINLLILLHTATWSAFCLFVAVLESGEAIMRMTLRKLIVGAPLLAALQISPVLADPITITLASPTSPTATEGDSITLVFEAANSSSSTYSAGGNGQNYSYVSGDPSDMPIFDNYNYSPAGYTGCASSVAPGSSCYFAATYDTPSETGETDGDSGVYQVLNIVTFYAPGQPIDYAGVYTNITVEDAASDSPVPEPITLSLFGAGLAGAFAMRRRKAKA